MACVSFAELRPGPKESGSVCLLPYLKFDPIPQTNTALSIIGACVGDERAGQAQRNRRWRSCQSKPGGREEYRVLRAQARLHAHSRRTCFLTIQVVTGGVWGCGRCGRQRGMPSDLGSALRACGWWAIGNGHEGTGRSRCEREHVVRLVITRGMHGVVHSVR